MLIFFQRSRRTPWDDEPMADKEDAISATAATAIKITASSRGGRTIEACRPLTRLILTNLHFGVSREDLQVNNILLQTLISHLMIRRIYLKVMAV
jgi:hypothetical protein